MKYPWVVSSCLVQVLKQQILQAAIALSLLCFSPTAHAQPIAETDIKAAIIYNLARFSEWPPAILPNDESSFRLCVLAQDPMAETLQTLSGKSLHGRPLDIQLIAERSEISNTCHLVFFSETISAELDFMAIAQRGILTIGDGKDFLDMNGGIAIRRRGKKLGFSINKSVMDVANVSPSSKILSLAVEVH